MKLNLEPMKSNNRNKENRGKVKMMTNASVGLPTSSIMTGLLSQRKAREFSKNSSQLFLRPTEEGKFYRVRLLNTQPHENFVKSSNYAHYRDFPFIIQHIHQVWQDVPNPEDPSKPRRRCHTIVCPQTDYVKANSTLSKSQCPMCAAYGAAWKAFSDSHYKNQEAKSKMKALHNTCVARVPVYIVNDPDYDANNGAVKVLSLDEDGYKALLTQIQASQANNTPIWNNDACDLFFTWGKVEKVSHEGKPNEYRFMKNGFTRVGFTTQAKHLDSLTDELVDDLQFDANWYQVPTKEELEAFYVENFSSQASVNDDIPMDIPPIAAPKAPVAYAEAVKPAPAKKAVPATVAEDPVVGDPIAKDVVEDADDLPFEDPAPTPPPPAKKAAPAKAAKPAPKTETSEDINAKIDDILAGMAL